MTAGEVDALFASDAREDRVGHAIHFWLAALGCFLVGWPTSVAEWAMVPLLGCFLVRMTGRHAILEPLAFDRVMRALLWFLAWAGLSVLWSRGLWSPERFAAGGGGWLDDVQSLRFLVLPLILWPAMDRRRWLIAALAAGIACGQASQIVHAAQTMLGASGPFHRAPGRVTGWWDPAVAGSVLCAKLGLWLGAAVYARTVRAHLLGMAGSIGTAACIALSGTRGAWIAAALLIAIAGWIVARRTRHRRRAAVVLAVALLTACATAIAAGVHVMRTDDPATLPAIGQRLRQGIQEVRGAEDPGGYQSDTGLRLAMWKWGWAAFRTHPLAGVGPGGYRPWGREQTAPDAARLHAPAGAIPHLHAHAHSWYIHTLATLGLIGGCLLAWLVCGAIRAGFRPGAIEHGGLWAMGPPLALLGLACAGLFDTITVNQQTMLLLCVLIGLCLPSRPREAATP